LDPLASKTTYEVSIFSNALDYSPNTLYIFPLPVYASYIDSRAKADTLNIVISKIFINTVNTVPGKDNQV